MQRSGTNIPRVTMNESLSQAAVLGPLERVISAVFAGGIGVGALLVAAFDPSETSNFPPCPLLSLTGIACPGCGLTRGFHALFHGDVLTALDFNAMIPIYTVMIVFLFVSLLLAAVRGRGLSAERFPVASVYGILGLAVVFTVLRNLPFEPFRVLYP
ncbi:MAG: DUF2752 domain-containing protein [Acidobacteria bacterium]|nr:DUF2752 domain-containing protein [Acidobacteriota bacterium]